MRIAYLTNQRGARLTQPTPSEMTKAIFQSYAQLKLWERRMTPNQRRGFVAMSQRLRSLLEDPYLDSQHRMLGLAEACAGAFALGSEPEGTPDMMVAMGEELNGIWADFKRYVVANKDASPETPVNAAVWNATVWDRLDRLTLQVTEQVGTAINYRQAGDTSALTGALQALRACEKSTMMLRPACGDDPNTVLALVGSFYAEMVPEAPTPASVQETAKVMVNGLRPRLAGILGISPRKV